MIPQPSFAEEQTRRLTYTLINLVSTAEMEAMRHERKPDAESYFKAREIRSTCVDQVFEILTKALDAPMKMAEYYHKLSVDLLAETVRPIVIEVDKL